MSISRISLALICVIFLWTSSAYAQWVNEPSGFQTTLDCPFNFKPTPSRDPAGHLGFHDGVARCE